MTLEEMLRRAYGVAMTPLPSPGRLDVGPLMAVLRGVSAPGVGELPQMPEAWKRYAEREGLYPQTGQR